MGKIRKRPCKIVPSLGYSSDIDITKYNPFVAAGFGDESSKDLQSGALVANMMKRGGVCQNKWNRVIAGEASAAISRDLSELAANGNNVGFTGSAN